jgi:ABC-type sugar transport system ATPase subunit
MMVGRHLGDLYPPHGAPGGEVIFRCRRLSRYGFVRDVAFEVRRGEILGLAGLVGSGRTEAMRALVNADRRSAGRFEMDGREIRIDNPRHAIRHGIFYVSEDRKGSGLFLMSSVTWNIAASSLLEFCGKLGLLDRRRMRARAGEMIAEMDIRPAEPEARAFDLSGGNQQKVLLGKALAIHPRLLIVDEPTRGVDIGAKSMIHRKLRELAEAGIGVIVISSEMPEVLGMSDRVLVFRGGTISACLDNHHGQITQEMIMHNATEI